MGNANLSTSIFALFLNKKSKFQFLPYMKLIKIQKCKEMFWFGSDWCKSTPSWAVAFLHVSASHNFFTSFFIDFKVSWCSAVSPCSHAVMVHFPGRSLEWGARAKENRPQRAKRDRACDVVLTESTCQDMWLEFLMGQQNKDSEAKKLYIQWQKVLPPNFVWVVSTDEWNKVLWISEVSVFLKCPHFLLGCAESVCDWGILAILNPSSCSLLLPGALRNLCCTLLGVPRSSALGVCVICYVLFLCTCSVHRKAMYIRKLSLSPDHYFWKLLSAQEEAFQTSMLPEYPQ